MEYNNPSFKAHKGTAGGVKFTDIALNKETPTSNMSNGAAASEGSALHAGGSWPQSEGFLSNRRIGILAGVVVFLVVLVIALAAGVNHHLTRNPDGGASLSQTGKDNPDLPWNNVDLPSAIVPISYSVILSIDPDTPRFTGSSEVTIECFQRTKYIVLHVSSRLTIYQEQVTIWKKGHPQQTLKIAQQFAQDKFHYHVIVIGGSPLDAGGIYVLRFGKFDGEISSSTTDGLFVSSYSNEKGDTKRKLIATNFNPIHARSVFPCFDEPSKRAVFNFVINHPPVYTNVVFNTRRMTRTFTPGSNQWVRDTFEATPPLPPHLLAIFIAERSYVHEAITLDSRHSLLLWSPSRYLSQTILAQSAANASYHYYSNYLATSPANELSYHVAIPEYPSGITTGWGLFFYAMEDVLADNQNSYSVSAHKRAQVCLNVARKMAHMFFGSIVTPDRWNDMWVAEGVSRVLAYDAVSAVEPGLSMDNFIIAMDFLPGLSLDANPGSTFILSYPITLPSDTVYSNHDLSRYKGSAVIAMTKALLGADAFQNSLQKYIQKYKQQSVAVEGLWDIMSREIIRVYDISHVVRTWSTQTGYPLVTLGEEFTHAHEMILVDQKMFRFDEESLVPKSPLSYIWSFQLNYATDQAANFRRHRWIEKTETRFNFPSSGTFHWITGNVDFEYFYRISLPINDWESVFILLGRDRNVFSPETVAMFFDSVFANALTDRIDISTLLRYLRALDKERSFLPWYAGMKALNFLRDRLQNTALLGSFQRFIVDRIRVGVDFLGWSPKPRDTFEDRYLRMLLLKTAVENSASYQAVLDYANILFTNWKANPNSIQPDQQYAVFYAGIGEGTVADWDKAWEDMKYTTNQDYRDALLYGLSAAREPWVVRRYLTRCLNDSALTRAQGARSFMQVVHSDYGRSIAIEFFKDHWSAIYKRFAETHTFSDLLQAVIEVSSSHLEINELKAIFSSLPPSSPLTTRVNSAIESATWNIKWLNKNLKTLTKLLAQQ